MKHVMLEKKVKGITTELSGTKVVIKADDFKLVANKMPGGCWHFDEDVCSVPTMAAHFSLRKQVHFALNPMRRTSV